MNVFVIFDAEALACSAVPANISTYNSPYVRLMNADALEHFARASTGPKCCLSINKSVNT